jgi:pilus assembly protein CpaB
VDVLISGNPPGSNGQAQTETKTVLQNIQVLSAGTDIQKDAEGKPIQVSVVNLLVTPEQAQLLSLAGNQTRIQLILRNPLDTKLTEPPATSVAQLYGGPAQPTPPHYAPKVRPVPKVFLVQVINGTTTSESKFPVHEEKQ